MTAGHPSNPVLRWFRRSGMTRRIALGLIIGAVSGNEIIRRKGK